ncbi:MAG: signal peptide peptidase SppA [Chloroflexi bacterium]|nr:signal peptide peptidase SppA [Chloroflexota bacterium]
MNTPTRQTPPVSPYRPPKPKNNSGSRSALWALLGVAMGFLLPVIACGGLMLVAATSAAIAGGGSGAAAAPPKEPIPQHVRGPITGPAVAIIDINGPIVEGSTSPWETSSVAAADDIIAMIRAAKHDDSIKAVVLEVNSPGGGIVPSDRIYQALQDMDKPIVVLMRDLAASGGYYISMAGDYIYANPYTLTGSIGVISEFPNASGLMDKLGIQMTIIKSGEAKDFGSPYREMTPEEKAYWQHVINQAYDNFVKIVAQGRHLPEDEVRKLADGRVYTGLDALDLGLVDALGYEDDAIAKAADLGDIRDVPRVVRYTPPMTPLEALLGSASQALGLHLNLPTLSWNQALAPTLEYRWIP